MHDYTMIFDHSQEYPSSLKEIRRAPPILYARGDHNLLQTNCLAIVGTRSNTPYGNACAIHFTRTLVRYGLTIVSGLAYGIDAIVHRTTLETGGKTIAVLGNGIDTIHPLGNEDLANEILEKGGLILSQYAPGTRFNKHFFPARNRIISGLSLGTLVIEAPEKSGALITARHAFEQNRDVFAIPGELSCDTFTGNLDLIADDMARLVRTPEDIIYHLARQPELSAASPCIRKFEVSEPIFDSPAQQKVWGAITKHRPLMADEILKKTNLSISEVNVALAYLELTDFIRDVGGRRYVRAH